MVTAIGCGSRLSAQEDLSSTIAPLPTWGSLQFWAQTDPRAPANHSLVALPGAYRLDVEVLAIGQDHGLYTRHAGAW